MRITFLISTSDGQIHLIQHNTMNIDRPKWQSRRKINVEREWGRYMKARPDVLKRFVPEDDPYEIPHLIGALEVMLNLGDNAPNINWFKGVEKEPWEEKIS